MTLDQAIDKAASDLDRHFERLNDQSWTKMVEAGLDYDTAVDLIAFIREANVTVRENAVAEIRAEIAERVSRMTRFGNRTARTRRVVGPSRIEGLNAPLHSGFSGRRATFHCVRENYSQRWAQTHVEGQLNISVDDPDDRVVPTALKFLCPGPQHSRSGVLEHPSQTHGQSQKKSEYRVLRPNGAGAVPAVSPWSIDCSAQCVRSVAGH